MHYLLIVALPGDTPPDGVTAAVTEVVNRYSEAYLVYSTEEGTEPGCGEWDEWCIAGRWHGSLTLTPDAAVRRSLGTLGLPREAECDCATQGINKTDCARLQDLDLDSLDAPIYWIGIDGRLHEEADVGTEANIRFLQWIQSLSPDTWLIVVDVHR